MRSRAPALLLAPLLALCAGTGGGITPPVDRRDIAPYTVQVDDPARRRRWRRSAIDMTETGYDQTDPRRAGRSSCLPRRRGRPTLEARRRRSGAVAIDAPAPKNKALGDSPNPFFNVWRSYSEPGGIADEMRALAAANPDVMKLEQIGTSTLGKPILAIKMTADARNIAGRHAPRAAVLGRSTTRVSGSRPSRAAACRSGSRSTRTTRRSRTIIAKTRAVVRADPERRRLRLHLHLRHRRRAGPVRLPRPHRRRQPLLAQDDPRQQRQRHLRRQPGRRRPEPQLPGQARDRRGGRDQLVQPARPTAARTRCRSPATSRSTASSAASSSTATSTTTPTASCC